MTNSIADRKTDHDKFKRLAVKRVNNASKHIRLIGNLSNRSNYAFKPDDIKTMFAALRAEIEHAEHRFKKPQHKPFSLE